MSITYIELLSRLGAAIVLGSLIGVEREAHEQSAGLRTHILVALASASFMLVSTQFVFFQHYTADNIVRADVSRIASNVVMGIGFLGGGAILHTGLTIKGLTTAASVWLMAAVGLAAGAGMYLLALSATLLTLFALIMLRYLVEAPRKRFVHLRVQLELEDQFVDRGALADYLKPSGAVVTVASYHRDMTTRRSQIWADVKLPRAEQEEPLRERLETLPGLLRVRVSQAER